MIPKRFTADALKGRKCRPIKNIMNGCGKVITPATVCTIVSVDFGVTLKTDPCPHCGQFCYMVKIPREYLELIDE